VSAVQLVFHFCAKLLSLEVFVWVAKEESKALPHVYWVVHSLPYLDSSSQEPVNEGNILLHFTPWLGGAK
jgi:hypothetical protein